LLIASFQTAYYNVFVSKFVPNAVHYIGGTMALQLNITNESYIEQAIMLSGASLIDGIKAILGIDGNETAWMMVVEAGRVAYAESYKYVYLASIAFGCVSIIASVFLGDVGRYMDDHIAVVMH
jgi:Fungal trichothecene efflux pump (TRI12)